MKANLMRAMSHDLRTPLTTIIGSSSTYLNQEGSMTREEKRKLVQNIEEDAQWLLTMVENLLSVTRIENGTMELRMQPELLDDIFREAVSHSDRLLSEHELEVKFDDELLMAYMDARLIVQVVINLINNAVKYTPRGSHICLEASARDDRVLISVTDDGNGISDEAKEKIFDMFYTGNKASSDARRGLGLGLALCKSIVEAHGGSIEVSDNTPHGAVFTFDLKRAEVQPDE